MRPETRRYLSACVYYEKAMRCFRVVMLRDQRLTREALTRRMSHLVCVIQTHSQTGNLIAPANPFRRNTNIARLACLCARRQEGKSLEKPFARFSRVLNIFSEITGIKQFRSPLRLSTYFRCITQDKPHANEKEEMQMVH